MASLRSISNEGPVPAVEVRRCSPGVEAAFRLLDIIVSVVLLVLLCPVLALVAIAIKLDSPGPILFHQRRLGRGLEPFTVHKLRTMWHCVDQKVHEEFVLGLIAGRVPEATPRTPRFKMSRDSRVTRVGHLLRRSSLDELPQLWNVLRGEMSLVGPRPPIPYEVEAYPAHWFARFSVKPGVTGPWQVSGRSELTLEEMIALDVEYAKRRSLALNAWILIRTVPAVLSRRGAS